MQAHDLRAADRYRLKDTKHEPARCARAEVQRGRPQMHGEDRDRTRRKYRAVTL